MDLFTITTQEILDRISRHCPEALSVYLQCLNRQDANCKVIFTREMVENDMSYGWAKFKNHVKKLALENLLEWHLLGSDIAITLAEFNEDE